MSIVPLLTHKSPTDSLYALAGAGGGGGGGTSITASTIAVSSMTVESMTFNGPNPGLFMENRAIQLNDATSAGAIGQAGIAWNNTTSNIQIVAPSTTAVYIGTEKGIGGLTVRDDGVYVAPWLSTQQVTSVTASLQNLTTSTINGSQPPISAAYPVSTLVGTNAYIPQGNVAWPLSGAIPAAAGHTYRISGQLAINNAGGTGVTNLVVSGGAGFPQYLHTYLNTDAIPGNNGLAGGVTTVIKSQDGTSLQIVGYNTDPSQSTLCDFYIDKWVVEDLGTNLL